MEETNTRFFFDKAKLGGGWWIPDLTPIIDQLGADSSVRGRTAVIFMYGNSSAGCSFLGGLSILVISILTY